MSSIQEQIDTYLQNMIQMQFKVSEPINHKVTKGELREKFIHNMVKEQFPNLTIKSGILCSGNWQSTQGDFLWLNNNARIGNLNVFNLNDCKMFIEIKSCAKTNELQKIENTSKTIKAKCSKEHHVYVGMLCYSTKAKKQTVLKNIGFAYDREIDAFQAYNKELDTMKHVDFLYSLNIETDKAEPYFVVRDYLGNCTLFQDNPVIQYFFNFFKTN